MKYCSRCTYPILAVNLTMREDGLCSGCIVHEEKYKINWAEREEEFNQLLYSYRNKDGSNYVDKNGKPFIRVSITAEGLERSASALVYRNIDPIYSWKAGDEVQAIVEQNGEYLNIRAAGRLDMLESRIEALERKLNTNNSPTTIANEPPLVGDGEDSVAETDLPF